MAIYGSCTAEAKFTLPVASTQTACADELARVGWLTIGQLATNGFAVQVGACSCSLAETSHTCLKNANHFTSDP